MFGGPRLGFGRTTLAEYLRTKQFRTVGLHSNPFLSRYFGYSRGFEVFREFLRVEKERYKEELAAKLRKWLSGRNPFYRMLRLADRYNSIRNREKPYIGAEQLANNILKYLETNKEDKLFLWAHFMDVHHPYLPDRTDIEELSLKDTTSLRKAFLFLKMRDSPELVSEKEVRILKDLYDAEIYCVDRQIGRILSRLEKNDLLDDTLIVVTADHGEEFAEHGDFTHGVYKNKPKLYDIHLHVPLIIHCPNESYYDVSSCVSLLDLAPTIVDILGYPKFDGFAGKSLLPLMRTKEDNQEDRSFFAEHEYLKAEMTQRWFVRRLLPTGKRAVAYRDYPHKLIYYEGDCYQLYHLETDPLEKNNLVGSSQRSSILACLKDEIKKHLTEIEKSKMKMRRQMLKDRLEGIDRSKGFKSQARRMARCNTDTLQHIVDAQLHTVTTVRGELVNLPRQSFTCCSLCCPSDEPSVLSVSTRLEW